MAWPIRKSLVDRAEASRALMKAIAHKNAGNDDEASKWAKKLLRVLQDGGIEVKHG